MATLYLNFASSAITSGTCKKCQPKKQIGRHGVVPQEADVGPDSSFRKRKSVCQPRLSGAAERVRHGLLDESQVQLLGQRVIGELLQQLGKLAGAWPRYCTRAKADGRSVRLYRTVLQPETAALP